MKTFTKLFLPFLICSFFTTSCSENNKQPASSTSIFYLKDVTASAKNTKNSLTLNAAKLMDLVGFDSNSKASVTYAHSIISEVHLNQVFSATIPTANLDNYNKFKRKNQVKKFLTKVDKGLKDLSQVQQGRTSSSIFIPVGKIINRLAKTKTNKQVLILYTDLFENTFILSKYDPSQMKKIEDFPKFLHDILDKETPIVGKLDKMTIYIVNQPSSDTDKDFYIISNIYKDWLTSKGARVEIRASL